MIYCYTINEIKRSFNQKLNDLMTNIQWFKCLFQKCLLPLLPFLHLLSSLILAEMFLPPTFCPSPRPVSPCPVVMQVTVFIPTPYVPASLELLKMVALFSSSLLISSSSVVLAIIIVDAILEERRRDLVFESGFLLCFLSSFIESGKFLFELKLNIQQTIIC